MNAIVPFPRGSASLRRALASSLAKSPELDLSLLFEEARAEFATAATVTRLAAANDADAEETIHRAEAMASRVIEAIEARKLGKLFAAAGRV